MKRGTLVEQELGRLAEAVAQNEHSRFLLESIAERERELDGQPGSFRAPTPRPLSRHPRDVRGFILTASRSIWSGDQR
jgi:hypothetical protein